MKSIRTSFQKFADAGVAKLRCLSEGVPTERQTVLPVSLGIGDTT